MILTIDIGNTNIGLRVFEGENIVFSSDIASSLAKLADEYGIMILNLLKYANLDKKISACAISSVVAQLDDVFCVAVKKYLNVEPFFVNYKIKSDVKIKIDNPKELGADRIANAQAVIKHYSTPSVVIDFGTATTFDVIDENNSFIGGLIAPGMLLAAKSLGNFTSKLPKIKLETPKCAIAKNTIDAMMAGIVMGHGAMIDSMMEKYEREMGKKFQIIATGGLSSILQNCMKTKFDILDKDLTHKGIKSLFEENL